MGAAAAAVAGGACQRQQQHHHQQQQQQARARPAVARARGVRVPSACVRAWMRRSEPQPSPAAPEHAA
eukprot:6603951-Prymnesium_polylepis.1